MGWLIALGVIVILAVLPLGVWVKYDSDGPEARLIAGPVRILLYPRPKKQEKKKDKPQEAPKKTAKKSEKAEKPPKEKGGKLTDFLPLVKVGLDLLGDFRRKLRVKRLKLHLMMAGDDPCDLAVNYGRANASMAALLAQLDRLFVIKKQDVQIQCDFASEETTIVAGLELTVTVGRLLALAAVYGFRALTTYQNIKKQQEGGADL